MNLGEKKRRYLRMLGVYDTVAQCIEFCKVSLGIEWRALRAWSPQAGEKHFTPMIFIINTTFNYCVMHAIHSRPSVNL